jgi:hypothetical protein
MRSEILCEVKSEIYRRLRSPAYFALHSAAALVSPVIDSQYRIEYDF